MIGLDTNVLLRYLLEDDPDQTEHAHRAMAQARRRHERMFVSGIVLCEVVWALSTIAGQSKLQILAGLEQIMTTDVFEIEEKDSTLAAIEQFRTGKGDFADYLIGQIHLRRGCLHTLTFDKALHRTHGFASL
jgi:predicted nucleic-acid-binding protein